MTIKYASQAEINKAVRDTSRRYFSGNVIAAITRKGRTIFPGNENNQVQLHPRKSLVYGVKLRVQDSRGPGAHRSLQGRRTRCACWHVYGEFFETLLTDCPEAVITTLGGQKRVISARGGNWADLRVGSILYSGMESELCECERD